MSKPYPPWPNPTRRGLWIVRVALLLGGLACVVLAPVSESVAKPLSVQLYRVREGDTVAALAKRFKVSESALRSKNGLSPDARCRVGDSLVIPSAGAAAGQSDLGSKSTEPVKSSATGKGPVVITGGTITGQVRVSREHTLQTGETLSAIAKRYGVDEGVLRKENGLKIGSPLPAVGTKLIIPLAKEVLRESPTSRGMPARQRVSLKPTGKGNFSRAIVTTVAAPVTDTTAAEAAPAGEADKPATKTEAKPENSKRVVGRLGVVTRPGGYMRRAPQPTAQPVYRTAPGNQLVIGGHWGDWYAVVMVDRTYCWIPKKYVTLKAVDLVEDPTEQVQGNSAVLKAAMQYYGCPYRYGGMSRSGIDCSALVQLAYRAVGKSLPRTAAAQFGVGQAVPPSQLQPGDRLYFTSSGTRIDHCGLYLGNGQMLHASGSAGGVVIENLFSAKQWAMFRGARR